MCDAVTDPVGHAVNANGPFAQMNKAIMDPMGLYLKGDNVMTRFGVSDKLYDPLKLGDQRRNEREEGRERQDKAVASAWAMYGQQPGGNRTIGDAVVPHSGNNGMMVVS